MFCTTSSDVVQPLPVQSVQSVCMCVGSLAMDYDVRVGPVGGGRGGCRGVLQNTSSVHRITDFCEKNTLLQLPSKQYKL